MGQPPFTVHIRYECVEIVIRLLSPPTYSTDAVAPETGHSCCRTDMWRRTEWCRATRG